MDTLDILQTQTGDLWAERRDLIIRLSRMEAYATQRRDAVRRFVDQVNDGRFNGTVPLKEHPLFQLLERDCERWEDWDNDHQFLWEERQ